MLDKLDEYIVGVAIGVRFRANFSIEDQLGKITDTILYSDDAFFNPSIFPLANTAPGTRLLINEQTEDKLKIDNSNVILEVNFENGNFKVGDLKEILEKFNQQIIQGVLKAFEIKEIKRIGYVRRYLFTIPSLASSFIGKTIGDTLEGVNDINLRFSKRIPLSESLVKKDVLDYDNVIFNIIKKANLEEIFMSVDYQSFFDPFLPLSSTIPFTQFINRASGFNNNNYLKWLNRNYLEAKNE